MGTSGSGHHRTLRRGMAEPGPTGAAGRWRPHSAALGPTAGQQPDLTWGQRGAGKRWWGAAEALHSSSASALADHRSSLGCVRRTAASSSRSSFHSPLLSPGEATVSRSGLPSTRESWTHWREPREWLPSCWEDGNISAIRRELGWSSSWRENSGGSCHCQ